MEIDYVAIRELNKPRDGFIRRRRGGSGHGILPNHESLGGSRDIGASIAIRATVNKYLIKKENSFWGRERELFVLHLHFCNRHASHVTEFQLCGRLAFPRKDFLLGNYKLYTGNKLFSQVISEIARGYSCAMFNHPSLFSA